MTGGRSKLRNTTRVTSVAADSESGTLETLPLHSLPSTSMAVPSVASAVDFYEQARKALTERCPFDSKETSPIFGTLPSAVAANLFKKFSGRKKHHKSQVDVVGEALGPGRPPVGFTVVWEKTETYFRHLTLEDIDLLGASLPSNSCVYIPSSDNGLENAAKGDSVLEELQHEEVGVSSISTGFKKDLENSQTAETQATQAVGEIGCNNGLPLDDPEMENMKSLNWILRCKQRFLFSSRKHSRKRKLLGGDVGLEQLLMLPRVQTAGAASLLCDFCCSGESDINSNRFLICASCKISMHQKCYGVNEVPVEGWLCSWCNYLMLMGRKTKKNAADEVASFRPCLLCPKTTGGLKLCAGNLEEGKEAQFAHLFCCLWTPGMYVEDIRLMEPVFNAEDLQESRRQMVCSLCKVKHGTCIRCSHGSCRTSFHPVCARDAKHRMEIWGKFDLDYAELRVFCSKHSHTQQNNENIRNTEYPFTFSKDDKVGKLLPAHVPIKRLPTIKIIRKKKEKLEPDEKARSFFDEAVRNGLNLDKDNFVISLSKEDESVLSNEKDAEAAFDSGNALESTYDFIQVFRKIVDHRKISIADVAVELSVPFTLLESFLMEEGGSVPSELKLKIMQWVQNFIVMHSSTCHSKSRIGCLIDLDSTNGLEVTYNLLLNPQPLCHMKNSKPESTNTNVSACGGNIEDCPDKELKDLDMTFRNVEDFGCSNVSQMVLFEVKDKLSTTDIKETVGCLPNVAKLGQLENVKKPPIMDISPSDDIDAELLYLQDSLLDRIASIKRSREELIYRIILHLPQELDAFRKRRWDMVLVSQYLREIKEAKKRGRKEKRHKEAQAILAAANAVVTTSRISTLRKDYGISNYLKINNTTRRAKAHSLLPGPRDVTSRSFVIKDSSDKHSSDLKFPDFAKENALFCDVCWRSETIVNRIFVCSSCKVAVHLDCYRRLKDPTGPWQCELCEDAFLQSSPRNHQLGSNEISCTTTQCSLCGGATGAFRKTIDGKWVHAFCAEWLLESTYKKGQQNFIEGMVVDGNAMEKDLNSCCICHCRLGLCLKCSYGHCQTKFHPTCARNAGLFMNIKSIGGKLQHKAYCEKHSAEQREKVENQHGAQELKNMKQVRVDLEKVRLLCERIIRREKLKRDLVVLSHGIFSSRRDCIAFSAMVRSSFTPGISSESATTSIDNPSNSESFQRCNEMAVDGAIYGRQSSVLLQDVDRKTDDSSTSQISNRRKTTDRIVLSGKQLPQRPIAGGEMRSKDRKLRRT